jgi:AcrR family transcriptional regulator
MTAGAGRVWGGMTHAEREQRRAEQLLEAGLEVFGTRGWYSTTVRDVCREANLSQRYFYEHFADREALFLAVVDRIAEQVADVVRGAANAPGQTAHEQATGVLTALAESFAADPRTVRVALVESFATEAFRRRRAELLAGFADLASRLMTSLSPEARRVDRRGLQLSALILSGGLAEALVASLSERPPASPRVLVAHLTRLYTAAAALDAA